MYAQSGLSFASHLCGKYQNLMPVIILLLGLVVGLC